MVEKPQSNGAEHAAYLYKQVILRKETTLRTSFAVRKITVQALEEMDQEIREEASTHKSAIDYYIKLQRRTQAAGRVVVQTTRILDGLVDLLDSIDQALYLLQPFRTFPAQWELYKKLEEKEIIVS